MFLSQIAAGAQAIETLEENCWEQHRKPQDRHEWTFLQRSPQQRQSLSIAAQKSRRTAAHARLVLRALESGAVEILDQMPVTAADLRRLGHHLLVHRDSLRSLMQAEAGGDVIDVFDVRVLKRANEIVEVVRVVKRGIRSADGIDDRARPGETGFVPERPLRPVLNDVVERHSAPY